MTVTFLGTTRTGGFRLHHNGLDGTRELTSKFRLRSTDAPSTAVYTAVLASLASNGIVVGSFSGIDGGCWITDITVSVDDPKNLASAAGARCWDWIADVTASSKAPDKPEDQEDPTQRPPTIKFSTFKYTSPALKTVFDSPLAGQFIFQGQAANSAGDPFIRERRRGSLVITIGKTFYDFDPGWVREAPKGFLYSRNLYLWNPVPDDYSGSLFGDLYSTGIQPGHARIEDLTVTPVFENGTQYARVEAEFHVDKDQFKDIVLDQGYTYLGPTGVRRAFFVNGARATTPQNLDGTGHPLAAGIDPVELSFQHYVRKNWNDLNLP